MRILGAVLRIAGDEHAKNDHDGWDGRRKNRRRGIFIVVVQFGDEHACDDVQALEGSNCKACTC